MSNQGFDYRVISMGVNRSQRQKPLRFAENDAEAVFDTFTSALGPATTDSSFLMLGADATTWNLAFALDYMRRHPPDYLLLYFSGHGADEGIALANGIFPYEALHKALSAVKARSILVILDACRAGNFGKFAEAAGVWESWADVLNRAMPGTRMFFATRPNENSREGNGVAAGHFTWSLISALYRAKGTLSSHGVDFISDIDAFNVASQFLKKRWPNDATPEWKGLRGDFPMLISQAETPLGAGLVYVDLPKTGLRADVTVHIYSISGSVHTKSVRKFTQ